MIDLADLIDGIRLKVAGDTYLHAQLGNQVSFGTVPQQDGSNQTTFPYCAIYTVGDGLAHGSFGGAILDDMTLQFSVWTTSMPTTSAIVKALGILFNNPSLVLVDNTLVGMRRSSTVGCRMDGQDQNDRFVYRGSVDFEILMSGC